MIKDITLGQFFPGTSKIHRMDPRVKLALTFFLIIFIFVADTVAATALTVAAVLALIKMTRVPFQMYIRGLKAILLIVLFTSVLNIFYVRTGHVLIEWGILRITVDGVLRSIRIAVRIAIMILLSSVLTYTTSPTDLTTAMERLMKPLKVLHVPVHEIAMMMTIALRFVPTLLEETDKITSAQKARGADMESGNVIQRMKAMIPILIPLFVSAFRRAYELAMAMECRCYHGGAGRTRLKVLRFTKKDALYTAVGLLAFGAVLATRMLFPGF
jgi:energy-coupling factor transport system permease protein